MTIQISVLIWTVICFCLLMLILDRLLFRPIHAFMDKRNERLRLAQEKKTRHEEQLKALEEEHEAAVEEARLTAEREAQERLELARREAAAAVEAAEARRAESVSRTQAEIETERIEMTEKLSGSVDDLARIFAEKLTIGL